MTESHPKRQAALAFILLTLFIDILGIGIVIPVLPELVKTLVGGSTSQAARYVGLISASYACAQLLFSPLLGILSDRFGRRPVLLMSLFGLGVDFLIQGLAPSVAWLFAGRILAGVMGASITTANAYIADVSTPATRARNYGLVGVMFGLGFIFGPALGGLLGAVHLRLPFFVSASLALLNWLYGFWILPESLPPEQRGKLTGNRVSPLAARKRLQAYSLVGGLSIAFLFSSLAHRGLENVWVLYTSYRFDWDKQTNGLVLGLVGLMAALVQGLLVRRVIALLGERRTVLLGLSVSAIAFAGYGIAYQGWMILGFIIFGSLGGVTGPAIQTIIAGEVDSADQGKIQGALTSLMSFTNILAPMLFTTVLFSFFTSERTPWIIPGAPFFVGSALLVTALLIIRSVFQRIPERSPRTPATGGPRPDHRGQ